MSAITWRSRLGTSFIVLGLHFVALAAALEADHHKGEESIQIHSHHAFVGREGKNFVLNGEPLYINGWNSYWLMTQAVKERTRSRVTNIFKHGAALGMTVCRSWAFNDATYDALQGSPGVYSEQTFEALDFVVAEAGRHGVRLLLTLVNNLPEYGGKSRYVQWARDAGVDLDHGSDDHFFTHPIVRDYYKAHVKTVLTRVNSITKVVYRNDPAILGWELINEPRCAHESSSDALQAWIEEMAAYVKSLDSKHLLTVGLEGFYKKNSRGTSAANPKHTPRSGTDFIENHEVAGIDFATVHAYPDLWMPWENHAEKQKFFNAWVDAHIKDATEILQMPVLFSEFGLFDSQHRVALYTSMYDRIYESAKQRGAGGGALAWQLLDEDMARLWNDGFAIFPGEDHSMVHLIKRQSCRLKVLSSSSEEYHGCDQSKFPQSIPTRHFEAILAEYQLMMAP